MTKQAELKKQAYTSDLKSRALSILVYLIDRSNQELTCFPAIPTIARNLHISVSTVKRGLRELEENGYIEKDSRYRENNQGQTSNLYTLILKETMSSDSVVETSVNTPAEIMENDRKEDIADVRQIFSFKWTGEGVKWLPP